MKKALFVLCLVLFLCSNLYAIELFQLRTQEATVSDFTLKDLSGNDVSLSDFKDKAVILFFWTTWCPHCRKEITNFINKYEDLKSADIELLAIDIGESKARVESFLSRYSIKFPLLLDVDSKVAYKYRVVGVPTIILISKEGNIVSLSHTLPDNYQDLLLGQ